MTFKLLLLTGVASIGFGSLGFASTITPHSDSFGTLPGATFGGNGIPNTAVAITNLSNNGNAITLGLTATPRYPNPPIGEPLPNDGVGTFFGTPGPADLTHPGYATWNYDFYINVAEAQGNLDLYNFRLVYSNNTTGISSSLDFTSMMSGTNQNSYNLGFLFSTLAINFNPNDIAQYGFELEAFDSSFTNLLGSTAINVNSGNPESVPDAGATVALLGLGLLGIAGLSLRKRFAQG